MSDTTAVPANREGVEDRLSALERAVAAASTVVRTRQLVIEDGDGNDRVVAEVSRGTAELRIEIPGGRPGSRNAVVVFATPGSPDVEPGVGVQLWAGGDAVAALDAWPDSSGRWRAHVHLGDGG
jgi:hypothetical protein